MFLSSVSIVYSLPNEKDDSINKITNQENQKISKEDKKKRDALLSSKYSNKYPGYNSIKSSEYITAEGVKFINERILELEISQQNKKNKANVTSESNMKELENMLKSDTTVSVQKESVQLRSYSSSPSSEEVLLCGFYPWECFVANETANRAKSKAVELFGRWQSQDGYKGNAFQHAYWNGLMRINMGSYMAERFATAHETYPNNPPAEKAMDLHNNRLGREYACELARTWWGYTYYKCLTDSQIETKYRNLINSPTCSFYWIR